MSDIWECLSSHLSGHQTEHPAGASASCPGTGWVAVLSRELGWPGAAVLMRQRESYFLFLWLCKWGEIRASPEAGFLE